MKPLQIRLTSDMRARLEQEAQEAGLNLSEYVRHLLRLGLGESGDRSAAIEYVWRIRSLLRREQEAISGEIADIIERRLVRPFREVEGRDSDDS